jgi:beclin 1
LPLVIDDSLEELSHAQRHLLTLNYGDKPTPFASDISKPEIKSGNIYNEYPKIPADRMKTFQDALKSNNNKLNISNKSKIDNDSNLNDDVDVNNTSENNNIHKDSLNEATDTNDQESHNSFVYLHDKRHNDAYYGYNSMSGTSLGNELDTTEIDKPFKNEEIKEAINKKSDISERVDSLEAIFNIISTKYEIDYPVCSDCASTIISQMKVKYETLNKEKNIYMQFVKKLTAQNGPNIEKTKQALDDIDKLHIEEEEIFRQLSNEDKRHSELNKELAELENEIKELEIEEKDLCLIKNRQESDIERSLQELNSSKNKYQQNMDFLDSLRKTNVFNNFFDISNDDNFGTINKLRLGCLDETKVTWHEINAALGQVILLLSTCLNILNLDLDGYKLIPMGSTSKIEKYEKDQSTGKLSKSVIQLYCTGEFSIGGLFSHNNLDIGMVSLAEVIRQIGKHLETFDNSATIPYIVDGDKVGGFCVRPSSRSGWVSWTSSCRCILINCKWILALCIAHYEEKLRGE